MMACGDQWGEVVSFKEVIAQITSGRYRRFSLPVEALKESLVTNQRRMELNCSVRLAIV